MKKARKEYIKSCEISEIVTVNLGGYPQKIAIEGAKRGNPVVLILHGGPGFNIPFCVGARGCFPEITKKFTAVYWDQLGCGINNCNIDDSFTVESFASMTQDLVRYLKNRFPEEKLFLFGISWGSILALEASLALPDLIDGVVTAGQVVLPPLLSDEFFAAIERSSAPRKVKAQIREIRNAEEKNSRQIALIGKAARKYTDAYGVKKNRAKNPVKEIFASKDYRFRDAMACFVNGYRQNRSLLKELSNIDLRGKFERVALPYTVYGGTRDLVTPVNDVIALFDGLNQDNLRYIVGEGEGHIPSETAMDAVFCELLRAAEQ